MFLDTLRSGGKERRAVELLKGLKQRGGHELAVAVMSHEVHYGGLFQLGIPVHYLVRKSRRDPKIFLEFHRLCKQFSPDIVHVWDSMTAMYAIPSCRKLRIRLVNGMITDAPNLIRPLSTTWLRAKISFPFSDVILANSNAGLTSYDAPPHKSRFVHNGFDFDRLQNLKSEQQIRSQFNIKTPEIVIMVASFTENKDYTAFVAVAERILSKRPDVSFVAVGDGKYLESVKALVHEAYKDNILFLGKQADVESIVNVASVGVLFTNSSLTGEGISNSIMEYMALGKPVLATAGGGTGEIVFDGVTGFLVDSRNIDALQSKLESLLDNRDLAARMGARGKELIEKEFSLGGMVDGVTGAYQTALTSRPH